jgi:hypothetical protein
MAYQRHQRPKNAALIGIRFALIVIMQQTIRNLISAETESDRFALIINVVYGLVMRK